MSRYAKFALMIVTSTALMLGLMYLNTYSLDHVYWSETRAYMALIMGAAMTLVMLAFMAGMYPDKKTNLTIVLGAAAVFGVSLYLVRSQQTIEDVSWMKAMIPHHSIAILTSERAHLTDPRVKKLAEGIVRAQREEIAQMAALIRELENTRRP
ncbi:FtsH-binding integral membrane protein [Polaromonas sp. CG_9.5]|uniref:DUF305 domain-containing protein n=1 Tax=Polaromonas sp. CG_9.5 TaxID=3071705 RepID=UPI002E0BD446|nr:FtsH-binding integral membrane protein [Polaromonas sp. CG_9.5]